MLIFGQLLLGEKFNMSDRPIYEKLENETPKAWEAFCIYRNMGHNRTFERVRDQLGKSIPLLERWGRTYNWRERVNAFDIDQEAITREILINQNIIEHKRKLEKLRKEDEEMGNAARATQAMFLQKLQKRAKELDPDKIQVKDLNVVANAMKICGEIGDNLLSRALAVEKLLQKMIEDEQEQD